MKSRAEFERTALEPPTRPQRVATGLMLAATLIGLSSTLIAGISRAATPAAQPDARGFQLTESGRIPADARADYNNAIQLLEANQYEQGVALLLKVIQRAPSAAAAYVDLGIAYEKIGDLDKALVNLRRAVELNPRQLVAYNELGIVFRRKGDFIAARQNYERALDVYPGFHYARLNLAILCDLYLRDLKCARDNYAAYQQLVPGDQPVAKWIDDLNARTQP